MNKIYGSHRQIILLSFGWWLFWCLVQTLIQHRIGLSWHDSAIDALVTTTILAIVGVVISNTFRYYRPVSSNFYLLAGYIIFLTGSTGKIIFWLLSIIHVHESDYLVHLIQYMPLRGMYYALMITTVTSFYWFKNNMQERGSMKQREEEAETLMREAELAKLRQQLQPHFLFNSLNSISALAGSKPEEARKMIQQLSDFLRGTLKKDEQQLVPLAEELKHLVLYLEIEKVRFGHRLSTEIVVDQNANDLKLPSLLLQPIVENAVKFGLYDTTEAIVIRLKAKADAGYLLVEVTNPFDSTTAKPARGTGFGLSSVQRRLHLLYGRNDLLFTNHHDNIFTTTIKIPQLK